VLVVAADRYWADRCPQQAAGIAYRVLFSMVPLAIVLVSVFGLVLKDSRVHDVVVDTVVGALPATAANRADVADAISGLADTSGLVGLVTLGAFAWAASGMMASIRGGLEVAIHATGSRPMARGKLVDFVLVLGAALLVLATVAATLLDKMAQHALRRIDATAGLDSSPVGEWLPRLVAVAASVGVVMLLYRFVPTRRLHRADALAGAVTTSMLLLAISLASSRIYEGVTNLSVVYGSLTATFVFLYSVYLYASALLFGGEVAAAWSMPPPQSGGAPWRVQVRRALRGLYRSEGDLRQSGDRLGDRERGDDAEKRSD
jgi:membrane protein